MPDVRHAFDAERAPTAFDHLLTNRHSCRSFLPEPVSRPVIEAILATAQKSASWCNVQPWQICVASGNAKDRFRDALLAKVGAVPPVSDIPFPTDYQGASLARRRECGFALYESVGIARGDREASTRQAQQNFHFFGAPHVAIVLTEARLGPYGLVDCGAYVMSFLLACTSHGVATIAQAALASRSDVVREVFGIKDGYNVVCGISFGFEDKAHPANGFRTTRASLDEAVRWFE